MLLPSKPPNPNCLGMSCCVLCLFLLHPSCVTLRVSLRGLCVCLFRCFMCLTRFVAFPQTDLPSRVFQKKNQEPVSPCVSLWLGTLSVGFRVSLSCLCLLCFLHPCFLGLVMVGRVLLLEVHVVLLCCSDVYFNLFGPFSIYASIYFCLPASHIKLDSGGVIALQAVGPVSTVAAEYLAWITSLKWLQKAGFSVCFVCDANSSHLNSGRHIIRLRSIHGLGVGLRAF